MTQPNFILLYVSSPPESAAFYARLLGREPIEATPTFAMFALDSGVMLGLWARHTVEPMVAPGSAKAGSELAFAQRDMAAVDGLHVEWMALGLPIIQSPTSMDFGYTFTAVDPDGHRLRAFAPHPQ
ncbi:VOC family protein [Roseateles oligotrophus]|uniref:VOC family protein n=1 Tax=Roseateles oligotrophus TaxID=1769250 RepID=A0ABT2YGR9_9BURK|nr:VOC family protein [Roseateles oligotrophus]MCV2369224.1 VOC family protein [Roseateles oligotrophus]